MLLGLGHIEFLRDVVDESVLGGKVLDAFACRVEGVLGLAVRLAQQRGVRQYVLWLVEYRSVAVLQMLDSLELFLCLFEQ